ncbi:MAG TPA: phenylalanine 4-monooxygenase, partial [Bacilli bacterium]|nr:phenylalanine 4-monooxygenase [Bacilli bacterium]
VCRDFDELLAAVEAFSERMAYRVGGTESLQKALDSANTATMQYSSGLQVSGTLTELERDAAGEAVYLKTTGATALAVGRVELPGHDKSVHGEGFGSPIGRLKGFETPLEDFDEALLQEAGLVVGEAVRMEFASGVIVRGVLEEVLRQEGKIVLLTIEDCTVSFGEKELFRSEWGPYHMAVGERITSVFAGAADREKFHASMQPSVNRTVRPVLGEQEQRLNELYKTVRGLREDPDLGAKQVEEGVALVLHQLEQEFADDWLMRIELLELLVTRRLAPGLQAVIGKQLEAIGVRDEEKRGLIANGLKLVDRK